jgi:signal transduction histidine kinase
LPERKEKTKGGGVRLDHRPTVHDSDLLYEVEGKTRRYAEKITEQIAGLQVFTAALAEALTPAAVTHIGIEQAVAIVNASAGSVVLLQEETSQLGVVASVNYSDANLQTWHQLTLDAPAPLAEAVRTGQTVTVESPDVLAACYPELLERHLPTYRATISVPLIVEAVAIGGMALDFVEPRSFTEEDRLFVFTIGRQLAQAIKRARWYEAEKAARAEAEAAKQRLQFLAEASAILAGSLDYSATLAKVAQLTVPEIADWCAVDVVDDEGVLERAAVAHADAAGIEWANNLLHVLPAGPVNRPGAAHVARTGSGEFYADVSAGRPASAATSEEHRRLLQEAGIRSVIIVSLKCRQRTFGAMTLVTGPSGRRFGAEDLALAEELAGRAALAIENARLYLEANLANEVLEQRVADRTREIQINSWQLEYQVEERLRVEEVLRQSELRLAEAQRIARLGGWQWHRQSEQLTAERIIHARGQMLLDPDGAVMGLVGTGQDVTEFKQTEAELARQHQRLQRRLQESEALAAINRELSETLDLGRTLRRIARAAQRIIPKAGAVVVHLSEPEGHRPRPVVATGLNHDDLSAEIIAPPQGAIGRAFYQGDVVHIADLKAEEPEPKWRSDEPVHSLLAVPIGGNGKDAMGVLTAMSYTPGAFSSDDERLLLTLALQASLAIQNTRLFEELGQEKRRLELLYDLSQKLSSSLDPGEVAERALRLMLSAVGGEQGEIVLLEAGCNELKSIARLGFSTAETALHAGRQLSPTEGLIGYIIQTRRAVAVDDVRHSEAWETWPGVGHEIRSLVVMPLLANDEMAGLLCLMSRQPNFYRHEQVPLLQAATTPVALAVTNARLYHAEQTARQVAERLFEEVRISRERLRQMAEEVVSAQEEERRRISRELHDEAGQALTGIRISLSLLRDELPAGPDTLNQLVTEAIDLTGQTMEQIRALAHALHPPALSLLGLGAALEAYCHDFERRTRLAVRFSGCELPLLPGAVSVCFYRFLQEALTNTAKHAGATHIEAALTYADSTISLGVRDNGRGFDPEALSTQPGKGVGLGLLGMQERFALLGGTLEIDSRPGEGVNLVACLRWAEEE